MLLTSVVNYQILRNWLAFNPNLRSLNYSGSLPKVIGKSLLQLLLPSWWLLLDTPGDADSHFSAWIRTHHLRRIQPCFSLLTSCARSSTRIPFVYRFGVFGLVLSDTQIFFEFNASDFDLATVLTVPDRWFGWHLRWTMSEKKIRSPLIATAAGALPWLSSFPLLGWSNSTAIIKWDPFWVDHTWC